MTPFLTTPHLCREEAVRLGSAEDRRERASRQLRLAEEADARGDRRQASAHRTHAGHLNASADQLEQDERRKTQ